MHPVLAVPGRAGHPAAMDVPVCLHGVPLMLFLPLHNVICAGVGVWKEEFWASNVSVPGRGEGGGGVS